MKTNKEIEKGNGGCPECGNGFNENGICDNCSSKLNKEEEVYCKTCGCTEKKACKSGCYWINPTICSACWLKNNKEMKKVIKLLVGSRHL